MCGIAGIFSPGTRDGAELTATVTGMTRSLAHRGPDHEATWVDPEVGIALGHRRLSVIDLSEEGNQPMASASGRYVLTINGEIYNYRELRADLDALGHQFRGHSDTEVLLAGFDEWGLDDTIRRSNGMFAFGLWDRKERELHLVRDRLGEKPLYYGRAGDAIVFGSELRALRAHPHFDASLDRDAIALLLKFTCIPAPFSVFQAVKKLSPGQIVTLRADAVTGELPESRPYWSLREVAERGSAEPLRGTPGELTDQLEEQLRRAISLRMVADVPLGAFLSGGIDSSLVVALMQAMSDQPVRTFSIGFDAAGYDEAVHAKAVAEHLGTAHTELYVTGRQALEVVPRLPTLYDEPFADSSQIPTFLVAELARRDVTVSLSGDGGDELFGGYNRYTLVDRLWRRMSWAPHLLQRAVAGGLNMIPPALWDGMFKLLNPMLPQRLKLLKVASKARKLAQVLSASDAMVLYLHTLTHWENPASEVVLGATEQPTIPTSPDGRAAVGTAIEQMMYLDGCLYLPDDILVKVDRATMAVALESRVPLLDHELVEFAWRLPIEQKVRNGVGKWLLREVLYRHVPRALVDRPKMGFGVPLDSWLAGPLREWAEDLLSEDRLRRQGLLDPEPIRRVWAKQMSGQRHYHHDLWDVLMLQAWLQENGH